MHLVDWLQQTLQQTPPLWFKPLSAKLDFTFTEAPKYVTVGGVQLDAGQVTQAIDILTSATSGTVMSVLKEHDHPLVDADFWDIYINNTPTIDGQHASSADDGTYCATEPTVVGVKKNSVLTALYNADALFNPQPPQPTKIPAPPTAAPVQPTTPPGYQPPPPPGTGVVTFDEHGYAVNHHRDVYFKHSVGSFRQRIAAIAVAFGPPGAPVVGHHVEDLVDCDQDRWLKAWTTGDLHACHELEAKVCTPHPAHPGAPGHEGTHRVRWQAEMEGEIPAGVRIPGAWRSPSVTPHPGEVEAYMIAAGMAHRRGIMSTGRHDWVKAHMRGQTRTVDRLSRTAKKHLDLCAAQQSWFMPYNDVEPVTPHGSDNPDDYTALPIECWPVSAVYTYTARHDLPVAHDTYTAHLDAAQVHQSTLLCQHVVDAIDPHYQLTAAPDDATALGGYHRKHVLVDQHTRRWLFKPAPDPEHTFRVDTEHEAHRLAQTFGYRTADSRLHTHDGLYGQAQRMLPVTRDLTGVDLTTLSTDQLTDIAREHLLDWALDNDDCHRQNIVELHDGTIVGIDKGRAWRYFGAWPGLTGDHHADTNCALVYTALYDAIAAHAIDQDRVDQIYRAVHARAMRMQRVPDDVVAQHVTRAVAHRPHFRPSSYQRTTAAAPTNAQELITAAIARKNQLVPDMTTLWAAVYQRAGWTPPDVSALLGENNDGARLYAGLLDPDLPAAVTRTKSYGTPTFVAGRDIDDAHVLLWRERETDGTVLYRGETRLNGTAAKALAHRCGAGLNTAMHEDLLDTSAHLAAGLYRYANRAMTDGGFYVTDYLTGMLASAKKTGGPMGDFYAERLTDLLHHIKTNTLTQEHPAVRGPQLYLPPPPTPGDTTRIDVTHISRRAASTTCVPKLDDDGELRLHDTTLITVGGLEGGHTGNGYLITLPTGERIEFRPPTSEVRASHHGVLRFTLNPAHPVPDGLRRVDAALTELGVPLTPATPADLELFYWRHLHGIISNRSDSKPTATTQPYQELHERCHATHLDKKINRLPAKENTAWRYVFAALTHDQQVEDWVTAGQHLPRIGHPDLRRPHQAAGRPHWERFDVTVEDWSQVPMPGTIYQTGPLNVLRTGACFSTEERIRALALWKSGMSSPTDQCNGSSHYLFLRLGREDKTCTLLFSPRVLARTSTYGFDGDLYGRLEERINSAYFAFTDATTWNSDSNEVMVKHTLTVLDDVELILCNSTEERQAALARFAAYGITHLRGVPVEHRLLVNGDTDRYRRIALAKALRTRR